MNKYTIEYWKYGLPHKQVIRYANTINQIKFIDLIISTSYKVLIWNRGIVVAKYSCD